MKKLLAILFSLILWSNISHSREYCFPLNEEKKILDIRTDSTAHLIFLGEELKCIGKSKEAKIYLDEAIANEFTERKKIQESSGEHPDFFSTFIDPQLPPTQQ